MRIYYLKAEYEVGKHKIIKVWSEYISIVRPEDAGRTNINVPYSVLELDERYNRLLAKELLSNSNYDEDGNELTDKYYVDNSGNLRDNSDDSLVAINPNPQKESYKLSALYGLTQAQLETYIDNNVTNLAEAKEFLKKLSAVVLWVVKQSGLDE
jgi:hypothetical protein